MKAAEFAYERPETLQEALGLLSQRAVEVRVIAGGQSLMPMMNFRLATPEVLVDLNSIDDLNFVRAAGETIEIGAMTRFAQLEAFALVAAQLPLVSKVLPHIGHPAIRNRGTIGGSIALADPAAEMPAVLLALNARIHAVSQEGAREIAADDFFLGPYETSLAPGEIIQMIAFPKSQPDSRSGFCEIARRHGDYAMAGAVVNVASTEPVREARIALFGVSGGRPLRATSAESTLNGQSLRDDSACEAVIDKLDELDFCGDLNAAADTKRHLAKVVLRRALRDIEI